MKVSPKENLGKVKRFLVYGYIKINCNLGAYGG